MPRAKKSSPTHSVLFRISEDEYEVLCAVGFLRSTTPTEVARQEVANSVERWASSERVERLIRERREFEAEAGGKLTPLRDRRSLDESR